MGRREKVEDMRQPKLIEVTMPYSYLGTMKMSVEEFSAIQPNPVQRNTIERAEKSDHLRVYEPAHCKVAVAVLNDVYYKVDGHTRVHMWENGMTVGRPTEVVADLWECRDVAAIELLYDRFDSRKATETSRDQLYGAQRQLGLMFESSFMRAGKYSNALKKSFRRLFKVDEKVKDTDASFTRMVVKYFSPEMLRFDRSHPTNNDYLGVFVSAAIITIMRYGDLAIPFWNKFVSNQGVKGENGIDGTQAARNLLVHVRTKKQQQTQMFEENLGRIINSFDAWRLGDLYHGKGGLPRPKKDVELQLWLERAIKAKAQRDTKGTELERE